MSQRFIARLTTFRSFVAGVLTLFVLTLALTPRAEAFVYWTDIFGGIGRANLDGTAVDKRFIPRVGSSGIAVDAAHVYWVGAGTIGRANLDGTGVDKGFITGLGTSQAEIAVDAEHIYWTNPGDFGGGFSAIGRANLDGTGVDHGFIAGLMSAHGVAVDAAHIYWGGFLVDIGCTIGRANIDGTGVDPGFIPGAGVIVTPCVAKVGAVDPQYVYWTGEGDFTLGRANLDGTGVDPNFITEAGDFPVGVAVDPAHIYWANEGRDLPPGIGRADLDGTGVDPGFITGFPPGGVAVDALRSFSFGKVKRNKRRGTGKLTVMVPGPGALKLAKTKKVKPAKKGADAEGSVKLPVRPKGNAREKLNRKGKAKVKAEVTYSPRGGDPTIVANTDTKTVKLVKR